MKILVTGGSGFIGKILVEKLLQKGHKITVIVRNVKKIKELKDEVKVIVGDIRDLGIIKQAVKSQDIVYHLAALIHPAGVSKKEYFDLNSESTGRLYKESSKAGVKHFIYISSVACYGVTKGGVLVKEDTKPKPIDIYGKSKLKGEERIHENKSIPFTIFRLGKIYGPGDNSAPWVTLVGLVKRRLFMMISNGKSTIMPLYIDDAVTGLISCLNNKKTFYKTYNLVGNEIVTKKEFIKVMAKGLNVKPRKGYLPKSLVVSGATLLEPVLKLFQKEPTISRKKLRFFLASELYDTSLAKKDLNFNPKVNLEEGMRNTVSWMKKGGLI
ncbi:MAG: NAD(P)-dependent oxidoreductase [Candidatus Woesearchaeota archaeon]